MTRPERFTVGRTVSVIVGLVTAVRQDHQLEAQHVGLPVVVVGGDPGGPEVVGGPGQVLARHPDRPVGPLLCPGPRHSPVGAPHLGRDQRGGVVGQVARVRW
jgi:hypothetical protein